jgi:hypothetical protein
MFMSQSDTGIGNVRPNAGLVEMAMAYSRSRMLCGAARLGIADALGDEERRVGFLAEACWADPAALYRLLRALAALASQLRLPQNTFASLLLEDY